MMFRNVFIGIFCSVLIACGGGGGGGGGGSEPKPAPQPVDPVQKTGTFIDSAVVNIDYETDTLSGVTNDKGEFKYIDGENVTFKIGNLSLPSVKASSVITPMDMVDGGSVYNEKLVNILRILQTLDEDSNPENGIKISDKSKALATSFDFNQSVESFEDSAVIKTLLSGMGLNNGLISSGKAIAHFEKNYQNSIKFKSSDLVFKTLYLPLPVGDFCQDGPGREYMEFKLRAVGGDLVFCGGTLTDAFTFDVDNNGVLLLDLTSSTNSKLYFKRLEYQKGYWLTCTADSLQRLDQNCKDEFVDRIYYSKPDLDALLNTAMVSQADLYSREYYKVSYNPFPGLGNTWYMETYNFKANGQVSVESEIANLDGTYTLNSVGTLSIMFANSTYKFRFLYPLNDGAWRGCTLNAIETSCTSETMMDSFLTNKAQAELLLNKLSSQ